MGAATIDLLNFLRGLRAIRDYTSEPVSDQTLDSILEVGRWSGSAANRQPTELVVIHDPETKRKFGEWGSNTATGAAAVLLLVTSDGAILDEGRMAERLLLAAAAQGLASNVSTLKENGPDHAKGLLGIPADRRAEVVVTIGHVDETALRARPKRANAGRKPMSEYVHREKF